MINAWRKSTRSDKLTANELHEQSGALEHMSKIFEFPCWAH